ncbi:PPOX class F420-dependent oxidoreductase [Mycolicibacter sinensis]|uniref:PPOX class F420-dependent enzyme n=1 Tax=Mycolicibacter sinensis (strain JDM601) TaxID=875328 RepID=A0A1A2E3A0_MYCSD|nr:PPOX class F420-dependent oxidoreductase [Mycolicibacter sinensis]OBF99601.1 PPOX class F420-dependent enzyme [Mycolicibacter sinensis]OBG09003.1 PPOX class F420-dependent enzyme [Mycolicibacter sinensis]
MLAQRLEELHDTRYALLRSFRRDGSAVDTPIWFALDGDTVVFRTKIGPKTRRLALRPDVELVPCDYRGRRRPDTAPVTGKATILSGDGAEAANRILRARYGWQWNVIPMIQIPGVTNVHRDLPLREKLRRARSRTLWPDSAIVAVALKAA